MTNITQHWAEIEALAKKLFPEMSGPEFTSAQALFHAGYCKAMGDMGDAVRESDGNPEKLQVRLNLLASECNLFAVEKGLPLGERRWAEGAHR